MMTILTSVRWYLLVVSICIENLTSNGSMLLQSVLYHSLPNHACMLTSFSHVWLFVTLWTAAHQGPLSMGFFGQEYWSVLPCPPPGDPLHPGIEPASLASPTLQVDSLVLNHWRSPCLTICGNSLFLNLKADKWDLLYVPKESGGDQQS